MLVMEVNCVNKDEVKKMLKDKNVIVMCGRSGEGGLCDVNCPLIDKCYGE